jgi:prepilin-type N-terminal cleavage/methylation domain-containing protein
MQKKFLKPTHASGRSRGFTLVELLVVIAIISILMTVGAIGIGGMTGGKGVSNGVATAEAVFDEARSIAVSKRTNARVLISIQNPNDRDTYLRRIVVAFQDLDAAGNPSNTWTLASRGIILPEQTYFSRDLSRKNHKSGSGGMDTMTLPSTVKAEYRGDYFYYEFNGEGICTTPGASFIVGTGARTNGALNPKITASAKRDFGGFVVWRNGRTSMFRNPEQMDLPASLNTF